MQIDMRSFAKGAVAFAASGALTDSVAAQVGAAAASTRQPAMASIQAYADAHRSWFGLPGLTLGVTSPSGFATVIHSGYSNAEVKRPISGETLFQIGSITKVFTAAL